MNIHGPPVRSNVGAMRHKKDHNTGFTGDATTTVGGLGYIFVDNFGYGTIAAGRTAGLLAIGAR